MAPMMRQSFARPGSPGNPRSGSRCPRIDSRQQRPAAEPPHPWPSPPEGCAGLAAGGMGRVVGRGHDLQRGTSFDYDGVAGDDPTARLGPGRWNPMNSADCPGPELLSAFVLGELTEPELGRVARHLVSCPRCEEQ